MILRAFLILLMLFLSGCKGEGQFGLHSSLVGEFATAKARVVETKNRYTIDLYVKSKGLLSWVRGDRLEHYQSKGHIRHGEYYADRFMVEKTTKKIHSIITYTFDYRHKKIIRHFRLWENGKKSDEEKIAMSYFGHNDFVTILHNALRQKGVTWRKNFIVAAADNSGGRVPVYVTHDPKLVQKWGGNPGGTVVQMAVNKHIFKGGKGSMSFVLNPDNNLKFLTIKGLKVVGKVTAKPIQK